MIKGRPILYDWLMRGAIAFQDGFFCDGMHIYFHFFLKKPFDTLDPFWFRVKEQL